jgi:hypothetical protein
MVNNVCNLMATGDPSIPSSTTAPSNLKLTTPAAVFQLEKYQSIFQPVIYFETIIRALSLS